MLISEKIIWEEKYHMTYLRIEIYLDIIGKNLQGKCEVMLIF